MSTLAELEAREAACRDEIDRLTKRLEDLYEGREDVSVLSRRFQEEMQRRYRVASSAASLSGLRMGARYAEMATGLLTHELGPAGDDALASLDDQIARQADRTEEDLRRARALLRGIRADMEQERLRLRCEEAERRAQEVRTQGTSLW